MTKLHAVGDPVEALAARAATDPHLPAVITSDVVLSAGELWDSALRIAVWLDEQGIREGEGVAISLPAPLESAFAVGALVHGAVAGVAVPGIRVGDAAPAKRIIAAAPFPGAHPAHTILVDQSVLARLASIGPERAPLREHDPQAPARIVFSSGTTGEPKAVVFSRYALQRRIVAARTWITDLPFMSLMGPASTSAQATFLHALVHGEPHVVGGRAEQNLAMLREHDVRAAQGSPHQWRAVLNIARRSGEKLPALQILQSAGAPMPTALAAELASWFGVQIREVYGATEVGAVAVGDGVRDGGPVGRVLPHATVEIEDDDGRQVSDGVEGSVRIRTDGLALGYLGVEGPRASGLADGWFRPGDRGFLQEGELFLSGRSDDLVNAAGVKIMPHRVEELALQLPGVEDVCVCAVVDHRGASQIALAYVGDLGDQAAAARVLRAALGDAAPGIIVRVGELARTVTGKLRRTEIQAEIERRAQSYVGM
ncbi:class I adenylate-forming enzyme family protein [Salinibacterium sp. ZJ77]|uniref:class I adenylate-forming enzyme family protein n=1 Tax=Salinibacterium sp. ZJ77 TaxID=2708337 RepID=UPI00141E88CB|nr:class I adenylate-forming enzyme family protein [Salinibacterium sp. ZJ77]